MCLCAFLIPCRLFTRLEGDWFGDVWKLEFTRRRMSVQLVAGGVAFLDSRTFPRCDLSSPTTALRRAVFSAGFSKLREANSEWGQTAERGGALASPVEWNAAFC